MVKHAFQSHRRQRGAALAVGLIILLIMTVLAVSMSQTTRLQEKVSGNARDMSVAQQAVESALRAGEIDIKEAKSTANCATCPIKPPNHFYGTAKIPYAERDPSWWITNGVAFGDAATKDFNAAYRDPHYVIEYRGYAKVGNSLATDAETRSFFTVTAEGTGVSTDTQLISTSVFTRND